jgi:hypothetical protein
MIKALALFSGGLDSILACRVIAGQGIAVTALRFVSPFFGYELLADEMQYRATVREKYGVEVVLRDISTPYLQLLRHPPHGFGKNFNPCIDCKIMLMKAARELMPEFGASFLISGEVIGQRPMSQRRDTLRLIERDSGCEGILLRPLCARGLEPTRPEIEGLVDREKLHKFQGRGRGPQRDLAAGFGITDYPNAGGGCVLTDPILAKRIERFYREHQEVRVSDMRLILVGRQFVLPSGGWLCLGRDEKENDRLQALAGKEDWVLVMESRPGPTALLRFSGNLEELQSAAELVVRFGKKDPAAPGAVVTATRGGEKVLLKALPMRDELFQTWYF